MSQVNILNFMQPSVQHTVAVSASNATQALTSQFISIVALGGAVRYRFNAAATATNGFYLQEGERLDIAVPEGTTLNVIQATDSLATSVEITELV
jgi:hypothetical protein